MQITPQQMQKIERSMLIQKLDTAMRKSVPEFAELSQHSRDDFLNYCHARAGARGLMTEQGIASYALAVWYLEPDFEEKSQALLTLLERKVPEVRKVHALNEWVHHLIGNPTDLAAADEALGQAFGRTVAWGSQE